ncbi:site-2 protease family protein [bacterium]|nr:site-2 protease family protein [bacterium]
MLLTIIVFLFVLGFLVFVHEFGHFILAKKLGVKVEEFGIGYPPALWKVKRGETVYSINAIPIGGFVKLYGEEGNKLIGDPRSFVSKPPLKRALIVIAGVAMNFIIASLIFYFLLSLSHFTVQIPLIFDYQFPFGKQVDYPMIVGIAPNSPAQKSGILPQDIVISGNNIKFRNSEELIRFINEHRGKEVVFLVKNLSDNKVREIRAVPRQNPPKGEGALGIAINDVAQISYRKWWEKPVSGFLHSLNLAHYSLIGLGYYIKTSFIKKAIEPLASSMVGPVGILALTKLTLQEGILQIIFLVAIISLALSIANLLPIPPLDGGRLVFILAEAITGKRVSADLEEKVQKIGMIFFLILFILVTSKDLWQFKDILF